MARDAGETVGEEPEQKNEEDAVEQEDDRGSQQVRELGSGLPLWPSMHQTRATV